MTVLYTIRTAVGILGNVIAFALFLSPVPTLYKIIREGCTGEYSWIPYMATLFNCMLWILYGLPFVTSHSVLVITINGIGTVIQCIYLGIFFYHAARFRKAGILLTLAGVISLYVIVFLVVRLAIPDHTTRHRVVGICCVVMATAMYASPLCVMKVVIQERSVKYMPLLPLLAGFLNGLTWSSYAFLGKIDPFIAVPNIIGTVLSAMQLIVYGIYSRKTLSDAPSHSSNCNQQANR